MRTCGNCGAEVIEGARFCPSCGHRLACGSCGGDLPPNARFCPSCGAATDQAEQPLADATVDDLVRSEERKLVTVLFADVTGSTALGEGLDPEPLRDVLDAYFSAMRTEIEAQGGTVEKFIGDAVMAVFGVPVAHEDDPSRALRAASRMLSRLDEVNAELRRSYGLSLQIRIGVNTGEVLASPDALPGEPMVTGDTVNTASRLQAHAEPGTVLVAERTARAARAFRFGEPITLALRGKQDPVVARRLLGVREVADRSGSEVGAPMVGRDHELELLTTIFERVAHDRRPHVVTIYGDPGVGKSRLTRELLGALSERPEEPAIFVGRCLPYGSGITYWPFAEILKARASVRDSDPPDEVLARLEALHELGPDAIDVVRMRAAFAATLGLEDPRHPTATRQPKQVRRDIHETWRWFWSSLSERGPVVAVVEDIHWADDALLDLLEELGERIEGPVLFVCPSRPELTERRPGWGGGRREVSSIVLDPLETEEAERLVQLLLDVDELPPSVRARILERAEGNPFFLEEIIRHLIDRGTIQRVGDRWRAAARVDDVDMPDTVQGVLAARIDLLEPLDKRVLQLAAVVGRVFWSGSVEAQLNGDGGALDEVLERLRGRDLVLARAGTSVAGEREFIFKHVLTRDVAYETLPRRDRGSAHRTVAAWIEDVAGERVGEFGELLAHHYVEAHEAERASRNADPAHVEDLRARAFEALLGAAENARRRFAIRHAFRLVDRALTIADDPTERARALESRGHIALADFRGDEAWAAFREAVDLRRAATPDDHEAIAYACARAVEIPMRWPGSMREWPDDDVVLRHLEIGLAHASQEPNETLVRLLTAEAFRPFGLLNSPRPTDRSFHDRAVEAGLRAADLAISLERPDLASAALDGATSAMVDLGMYGETRDATARRLALVPSVDDPWERGDIYAMAAWSFVMLGEPRTALRWADEGSALQDEQGAEGVAIHSLSWATYAEFELGEWDEALRRSERCRQRLGERAEQPPYFTAHAFCAAALIHRIREEPAGLDRLRPALDTLTADIATLHPQGGARMWLAEIAIRDGRFDDAESLIKRVRATPTDAPRPLLERVTAEHLAASGRWDDVPGFLESARSYAAEAGLLALPHHLDRLEARLVASRGEPDVAVGMLTRAADGLRELEQSWHAARFDLEAADAALEAGATEAAREALDRAEPVHERLRSLDELRRCRAARERLG